MSVVNCKVKYIRPTYSDLRDWMACENNIYIGRKGIVFIDNKRFPEHSSKFANPYKIGKDGDRETVLHKYRLYILNELKNNTDLLGDLVAMKGKTLGCWCCPDKCHGDILLELIDKFT